MFLDYSSNQTLQTQEEDSTLIKYLHYLPCHTTTGKVTSCKQKQMFSFTGKCHPYPSINPLEAEQES